MLFKVMIILVILLYLTSSTYMKVSYAGFSLLEVVPSSDDQLNTIMEMMEAIPCRKLTENNGIGRPLNLLCNKIQTKLILKIWAENTGSKIIVKSRNFQKEIEKEIAPRFVDKSHKPTKRKRISIRQRQKKSKIKKYRKNTFRGKKGMNKYKRNKKNKVKRKKKKHENYIGYKEMVKFLEDIVQTNDHVTLENIGTTLEKRDIKIIKINSKNASLPIIFIDAGIHAREWIAPAATLFVIERLVKTINRKYRKTKQFQWHIIPMANPDGYEYSRTEDRLWRKNRRPNEGSKCIGVDLNRNFPEGYGVEASDNPCKEDYIGPEFYSEPESRAIRDYLDNISGDVKVAISVHAYGNVIIYPWGYKREEHQNREKLAKLTGAVREAIIKKTGEVYEPGTAVELWGKWGLAGGATDDYYISRGIPYSFTFELPEKDENGEHGFLLPPENIKRVGKQLMIGLKTIARVHARTPEMFFRDSP